ncbi:MAG: SRPBCC domain-containing protein [Actinomycetales bacterium]|nr:SRPBCC domain-containing protein [Actinomycetales bacterium]
MSALPALRRQIVVAATPERAYRAWTERIGAWWPLERFAVFDAGTTVAFEGDEIVETSASGERSVWGTVREAHPPHRLRFSWHPGSDDDRGEVEVAFVGIDATRTLVTLEHRGWEHYAAPAEARDEYRSGWPLVLERFARARSAGESGIEGAEGESGAEREGGAPGPDPVWLVLDHTVGAAAGDGSVFAHPLFGEHLAFLRSAGEAGVLVAAGPLPDDPGHGQTVIRVDPADAAYWVAAAEADGSVAGDLFVLRVRPWAVQVSGV